MLLTRRITRDRYGYLVYAMMGIFYAMALTATVIYSFQFDADYQVQN